VVTGPLENSSLHVLRHSGLSLSGYYKYKTEPDWKTPSSVLYGPDASLSPEHPNHLKGFAMKRSLLTFAFLLIATFLPVPTRAHADSLFLQSITPSGGNIFYKYDLIIDPPDTLTFDAGQGITLTGLFGVNNVGVLLSGFTATFTPTTVTLTSTDSSSEGASGEAIDAFIVSSTSSTVGAVDYSISNNGIGIDGQVGGPVAPTPEPSSLLLFSTGILGLAQTIRRKFHA
jgi:hypothetical protein